MITRITYIHMKPDLVGWQQDCPGDKMTDNGSMVCDAKGNGGLGRMQQDSALNVLKGASVNIVNTRITYILRHTYEAGPVGWQQDCAGDEITDNGSMVCDAKGNGGWADATRECP